MPLTSRRGAGAFVCTANSACSHLAARCGAGKQRPAASACTHPAPAIDPGTIAAARRHRLPLPGCGSATSARFRMRATSWHGLRPGREELGGQAAVHWPVPGPVLAGDPASFDAAISDLSHRVERLAPSLAVTS